MLVNENLKEEEFKKTSLNHENHDVSNSLRKCKGCRDSFNQEALGQILKLDNSETPLTFMGAFSGDKKRLKDLKPFLLEKKYICLGCLENLITNKKSQKQFGLDLKSLPKFRDLVLDLAKFEIRKVLGLAKKEGVCKFADDIPPLAKLKKRDLVLIANDFEDIEIDHPRVVYFENKKGLAKPMGLKNVGRVLIAHKTFSKRILFWNKINSFESWRKNDNKN